MSSRNTLLRRGAASIFVGLATFSIAACGSAEKPSEAELSSHLSELLGAVAGLEGMADKIADCAAPKLHKDMSADGLEALMDATGSDVVSGGGDKISKDDEAVLTKVLGDCAAEAATGS